MKSMISFAGFVGLIAALIASDGGSSRADAGWGCHGARMGGCGRMQHRLFGRSRGHGCHGSSCGASYGPAYNTGCGTPSYSPPMNPCDCHGAPAYGAPMAPAPYNSSPPPVPPTMPSPSDQPQLPPDGDIPPAPDSAANSAVDRDKV